MTAIMSSIIAIVVLVIGLVIVDSILKDTTFNSSLANTVKPYVVPIGLIGALSIMAAIAGGGTA